MNANMPEILLYAKIFFIFVIGVILGRLTMTIQYALMKPVKKAESKAV
jgi:hypothetical protein